MTQESSPESLLFKKLEVLLESRGLDFTPPMRFQYWHDPGMKAIFCLIMELFEKMDQTSTWDVWGDFEGEA